MFINAKTKQISVYSVSDPEESCFVVKPLASIVKAIVSIVEPLSIVKSIISIVKPITSIVEALVSIVEPLASIVKPIISIVKPLSSIVKPFASIVKAIVSIVKPITSIVKPITSIVKPLVSVVKPTAKFPYITILAQKHNFYFMEDLPLKKVKTMSEKNKKQFGVWMDTHHATIVGKESNEDKEFEVIGTVKNAGADNNSNENAANNHEKSQTLKFFKEIASKIPNVDEIHITGTGQVQEQFIKFLADTPQYKHALSSESTSNEMSNDQLISFIDKHFN